MGELGWASAAEEKEHLWGALDAALRDASVGQWRLGTGGHSLERTVESFAGLVDELMQQPSRGPRWRRVRRSARAVVGILRGTHTDLAGRPAIDLRNRDAVIDLRDRDAVIDLRDRDAVIDLRNRDAVIDLRDRDGVIAPTGEPATTAAPGARREVS
jgi:hypothetical protein